MDYNLSEAKWFFEPKSHKIEKDSVEIITDPGTDFWQRTYYGFQNDNAHVLYVPIKETYFTFGFKVVFDSSIMFDQCGIAIYQNSDNWIKAGIEYKDETIGWLGSVVTNHGYSDWATTEVSATIKAIWYRLSRRESDFLIESSLDGETYKQMRIFHLFEGEGEVNVGLLACSPLKHSFKATFTEIQLSECLWKAHE